MTNIFSTTTPLHPTWSLDDIVFEHRNKTYGAYDLQKIYRYHLTLALGLTLAFIVLASLSSWAYQKYFSLATPAADNYIYRIVETGKIVANEPISPPIEKPQAAKSTIKRSPTTVITTNIVQNTTEIQPISPTTPTHAIPSFGPAPFDGGSLDTPPSTGGGNGAATAPDTTSSDTKEVKSGIDFVAAVQAQFPGGVDSMYMYLSKNIPYPEIAAQNGIEGKMVVRWVVEKDGSIGDVVILKEFGYGTSQIAKEVIKKMPKWTPGKNQIGNSIRVWFTAPILFTLHK